MNSGRRKRKRSIESVTHPHSSRPLPTLLQSSALPRKLTTQRAVSRNQSIARVLGRQSGEIGETRMGRDKRWESSWLRKGREGQRRQLRSVAVTGRQGRAAVPTWNSSGGGCRRHLWPLLLRLLPLPLLLLLLLLLDETEVGAAELGSSGRGDQPRLQQHRGQAEQQGTRDAPAEPRHGREPEGRGGILRGSRRPRTPGLRAPAAPARSSLPRSRSRGRLRTPSPGGGGRGGGGGEGGGGGGGS